MKIDKKKLIDILGKILMVISLVFIVIQLYKYKIDFTVFRSLKVILILLGIVLIQGILTFLPPFNYNILLRTVTRKKVPFFKTVYTYSKSNLYKYLPGNVMHYVGRNQLAVEEGLSHGEVIFTTISEVILILFSGGILTLILAWDYLLQWFTENSVPQIFFIIIGFIALAIILAIIFFRKKLSILVKKYSYLLSKNTLGKLLFSILFYSIHFMLTALVFCITFITICGSISSSAFLSIAGLSIMAWIVGFITPGVPGGIGVREAVMTMFLSGIAPPEKIITAVVLYRIICVLGDIVAYLISSIYFNTSKKRVGNKI